MLILNVKGFIKIKANFSLVYVIMTLVIEMKKIVIKENDTNQRIDKYLKKLLCNAPSNFIYKMFRKKDIKNILRLRHNVNVDCVVGRNMYR